MLLWYTEYFNDPTLPGHIAWVKNVNQRNNTCPYCFWRRHMEKCEGPHTVSVVPLMSWFTMDGSELLYRVGDDLVFTRC